MTTMAPVSSPLMDVKPWFIDQPDLAALHGGRAYFRFPTAVVFPAVRLYYSTPLSIAPNGGGIPLLDAMIAFDIFGDDSDGSFQAVDAIATTLVGVLDVIHSGLVIGATRVLNVDVIGGNADDDPATGWPRRVVDTRWLCVAANS